MSLEGGWHLDRSVTSEGNGKFNFWKDQRQLSGYQSKNRQEGRTEYTRIKIENIPCLEYMSGC